MRFGGDYVMDLACIRDRVMLVLKLYDKINPESVSFLSKLTYPPKLIFATSLFR